MLGTEPTGPAPADRVELDPLHEASRAEGAGLRGVKQVGFQHLQLQRHTRAIARPAQVVAHLAREGHAFAEADVISALQTFEDVWGQLFPAKRTGIVQLLVRRVTVTSEGLVIDVRTDGVSGVMRDMMAPRKKVAAE